LHAGGIAGPEWTDALNRSDAAVRRIFAHLLDFEMSAGANP